MKNKSLIVIIFVLVLFLMTSCNKNSVQIETEKGDAMKNHANFYVQIYKISRDTFESFLSKPSVETLSIVDSQSYIYPENGQWYVTHNVSRFPIQQSLIDFVGNQTEIESYLLQHNINGKIKNTLIFEAPYVPLTLWVQTDEENVFITINEQTEDALYVYRCYTSSDYNEKYGCVYALLNVKGKNITDDVPVKMYYNYADIPFTSVLKSLGATLTWESDSKAKITFNEKIYILDVENCELYEAENKTENMLYQIDGGRIFVYPAGQELMVDSNTLVCVLEDMGENVAINCNKTSRTVTIK